MLSGMSENTEKSSSCRVALKSETRRVRGYFLPLIMRFHCHRAYAFRALPGDVIDRGKQTWLLIEGVDKTWGSCGAFSVCDGQPTIENCGPCDGYSVSPFGRPPHPSALSHAGIGNVID